MNPVDVVVFELRVAGLEPTIERSRRHTKIRFVMDGKPRLYIAAGLLPIGDPDAMRAREFDEFCAKGRRMAKPKDIIGKKFGRLLALSQAGVSPSGNVMWLCRCDCGEEKTILSNSLRRGITKSCGCLNENFYSTQENTVCRVHMHTPLGVAWISRCTNPNDVAYIHYGGRGIRVCNLWRYGDGAKTGFKCRLAYIRENLGPQPSPKHTIDRIDNDGHYGSGNLRWATPAEQKANSRPISGIHNGQAKLTEKQVRSIRKDPRCNRLIAVDYEINSSTVSDRARHGLVFWPINHSGNSWGASLMRELENKPVNDFDLVARTVAALDTTVAAHEMALQALFNELATMRRLIDQNLIRIRHLEHKGMQK
jgi:hypothetical protein